MAKSKSKKLIYIGIFVIGITLLMMPLITKNHIYQGVALGDDTMKCFIPMINSASDGNSMMSLSQYGGYVGLWAVMWVLGTMNRVLQINPAILFYLYSICVLMGASITLYYLGKFTVGVRGGWIVMVMGMLCSTSILALYTWGCTVNIINVYIFFLWGVILIGKWVERGKWHYLLLGLMLLAVFVMSHATGTYLALTMIVLLAGLAIWRVVFKGNIRKRYIILCGVLLVGSFYPAWRNIGGISFGLVTGSSAIVGYWEYFLQFIRMLLAPIPIVIGILVVVAGWRYKRKLGLTIFTKVVLAVLFSLLAVLGGAAVLRMTALLERQILDASAIMAIIIAILLAHLVKRREFQWLRASSYALMALGGLITIHGWIV